MLGLLAQDGYAIVPDSVQSDLVVINTCGFIDAARRESIGVIEEMLERKRSGAVKGVIVAGCLAERQKETLLEQFPEVDQVVGVFGREEIARVADRLLGGLNEQRTLFRPAPDPGPRRSCAAADHPSPPRLPQGLGRVRPILHVLRHPPDARQACDQADRDGRGRGRGAGRRRRSRVDPGRTGHDLLRSGPLWPAAAGRALAGSSSKSRGSTGSASSTAILNSSPTSSTTSWAHSQKIIPYLDMPLQHINDRLLKLMNRRHNRSETESIIARLRATIPGLVLRTTFIVGFPGETEAEFAELLDFVAATKFERLGAFTYSFEPDTPAAKLPDHLPAEVKAERQATTDGRAAADRLRVQSRAWWAEPSTC